MHLLIVDTRLKHALADGEYQHRRATCEAVAAKLGVPSLRDAHLSDVSRDVLSDRERACLRHVVTENTRVASAAEAIERGTATSIGPLLFASHASLRDDFQVSTEHLDFIVDAAKAATSAGIWGARMTGAGFGGSVIVAGDRPGIESFGSDIAQRFESRFHKDCTVCEVAPAAPAGLSPF
jgi:galactokinase